MVRRASGSTRPPAGALHGVWRWSLVASMTTALLSGCLPEPKTDQQLAEELAEAQDASAGGGDGSSTGTAKCSSGDMATVTKVATGPVNLVATCLVEEWVDGCGPTAKCVGQCFSDAGTSKACEECQGLIAGQCVANKCAGPCKVGGKKSLCANCVGANCGSLFEKCL